MRLWHQELICYLPREQLLGQHREICALRGLGYGRKHKVVNYVFTYPYAYLFHFHLIVILEMKKRGYTVNDKWLNIEYRGKILEYDVSIFTLDMVVPKLIFIEHNDLYLKECLLNLYIKKVILNIPKKCKLYYILDNNNLLNYINVVI